MLPRKRAKIRKIKKPQQPILVIPRRRTFPPGKQITAGKHAKAFAQRFSGKDIETIKRIVKEIHSIEKVAVSVKDFIRSYGKRNSENILSSKKILTFNVEGGKLAKVGCNDLCIALLGVLKAKGIPATYVRELLFRGRKRRWPHSRVKIKLGKKEYLLDPFTSKKEGQVKEIDFETKKMISKKQSKNTWIEAKDAWSLGINDWGYFLSMKKVL